MSELTISEQAAAFAASEHPEPVCEVVLGAAGTGKSTLIRERSAGDPNYCKLCATTGIAAINLGPGVTTVNSVLGFYNTETAWDALESGRFRARFRDLAEQGYKYLVIDEVSMMPAETLTAIALGAQQGAEAVYLLNEKKGMAYTPTGIILTGDFLQLSPVKAPYAFTSPVWPRFERGMTKLEKVYRQDNPLFLEALQAARAGRGTTAVLKLNACGVKFASERNDFFDGTSIVPTNDIANKINQTRYETLTGTERVFKSCRWGKEGSEWRDIPEELRLKDGAFIMVLANKPQTYEYVNGDQGIVKEMSESGVTVEIHRGQQRGVQEIPFVWRETVQKEKPEGAAEWSGVAIATELGSSRFDSPQEIDQFCTASDLPKDELRRLRGMMFAKFFREYDAYVEDAIKRRVPFWSADKKKWVVGWIEYIPLRLAYASTVHKTQGLTLDAIQIDARNRFAGSPGMQYVALSRCRQPENIRIVANQGDFARRIQTATECLRWV